MNRRSFITLLGGAAAWPLAARAQQPAIPVIGFLGANTAAAQSAWTAVFVERLGERGWVDGRTVAIEYRWAEGRNDRAAEIAAEFVRRKVDVIVTSGTAPALAAKQATSTIPIVFALTGDPVGTGLVASLARPGGNVTGLSNQSNDLAAKRLEFLREVIPAFRRLAIMANGGNPAAMLEMSDVDRTARAFGLDVATAKIQKAEDIDAAFATLKADGDALYFCTDPLIFTNRVRINTLALSARLPTMYGFRAYVETGGLMSYGANFRDQFARAAELVDRILHGTKPADLPVEQPTKFDLVINLTTAKALGLDVPPTLLARADEVIE